MNAANLTAYRSARAFFGASLLFLGLCGIGSTSVAPRGGPGRVPQAASDATPLPTTKFAVQELLLPGASGVVTLDYFAYDRSRARLWVPAGNTGSVDVIDGATDQITRIGGFATAAFEFRGKQHVLGPSSVSIGEGVVYVGNRADSSICIIDAATLKRGKCIRIAGPSDGLAASPDGLAYIATTKELWVTTGAPPLGIAAANRAITILDASLPRVLKAKAKLPLEGSAEGYAVDEKRGLFYTNLEEDSRTIAIDVRRRVIVSSWRSGCDEVRGLALDKARRFLFVACADRVVSLDVAHAGRVLGSITAGDGLDNIDFLETQQTLYAAASKAATLVVAKVDDRGNFTRIAVAPTVIGARGAVVDGAGRAYVADPVNGRILKFTPQ